MINVARNTLNFNTKTSEKIRTHIAVLMLCIFFCLSAKSQVSVPVPVVTMENTPTCGENAILIASLSNNASIPNGYICQWFTDAECTHEITSGYSGTHREHLEITSSNGLTIYCRLRATTTATLVTNFPYTGSEQIYNFPTGYQSFKLEVWGAQGGGRQINGRGGDGGKGGYSVGTLNSSSGITSIYVYVGGMGSCSPDDGGIAYGGWNGGGTSWASPRTIIGLNSPAAGGGGGTDIRVNGNTFYNRIIVAGGGGGGGEDIGDGTDIFGGVHGYGGGLEGGEQRGGYNNNTRPEHGGSQTEPGLGGAFGLGANTRCDGGGGGGGWYGGGTYKGTQTMPTSNDSDDSGRGGGGSGYVYTSSTASNYPSGCRLNSSLYLSSAQTIDGKTSFPAVSGGNETGHEGNGYARITTVYYPTGTAGNIVLSCCNPADAPRLNHISGFEEQHLCGLQSIENIVYTYGGAATGIVVNGTLPDGVTYSTEGQTLTISGTPTETGSFTFSVSTTSSSSLCDDITSQLSITIYSSPTVSISAEASEVCNGSSVTMTSNPDTFNSYSWTCASSSNDTYTITTGMPSETNNSSLTINPTVSQGNTDVVYNLVVTDANNCTASATNSISISRTPAAEIASVQNTRCIAPFNGSITVSDFSGGLSNSTYTVSVTGQATQTTTGNALTFRGLETGSYTVRITNESTLENCYYEEIITVGNSTSSPTVTISGSNTVCYGTSTTLCADVSGGLAPYTYLWSDNSTEQTFVTPNITEASLYSVTVTDENNCSSTASVNVTIGDTPEISLSATTERICLGKSASLQANVSNAGSGYSVQWSATPSAGSGLTATSDESITITPTAVGTYKYKVTLTAYSCGNGLPYIVSDSVSLTVNALPNPTITNNSGTNELNCSVSAISVTANGGTSYQWSNSASTANNTFATAGTYYVTVTDINGCSATSSISVSQADEFSASVSSVGTISCYGGTTSASVTVSGGSGNYEYHWSDDSERITATANGLHAGTYTVTINDTQGCSSVKTIEIAQPDELTASLSAGEILCYGETTTATITANGGSGTYQYHWNDDAGRTTATANGLHAGTYTITVNDTQNCSVVRSIEISQPNELTASLTANGSINCYGGRTSATVNTNGGTPDYSYVWSNNVAGSQSTTANNLSAGTYTVTVNDTNGCSIVKSIEITQPNELTATLSAGEINCGGMTANAIVTVSGGTGIYVYHWSDNVTSSNAGTASNLSAGTYTVTVNDANGCSVVRTIEITQPDELTASLSAGEILCYGETTTATITANGGSGTYQYQWSDDAGRTTAIANGLHAGTYTITVNDTQGCSVVRRVEITQPRELTASLTANGSINCYGGTTSATVNANGGTPNYSYVWSNNVTGSQNTTANNLSAGTYTVTVNDANGCSVVKSIEIAQPTELATSLSVGTISCYGGTTSASVTVSGGTPMYHYAWSNGQNAQTTTGLSAGSYTVTVSDSRGCSTVLPINITQPMELNASIVAQDVQCGILQGSLNATVLGGTQPYTYMWSNGINTAENIGVAVGSYELTVVDSNGCSATSTAQISRHGTLSVTASVSRPISCHGFSDGAVAAQCPNAAEPIIYSWNTGNASSEIYNLFDGTYMVTVTDFWGCTGQAGVSLVSPPEMDLQEVAVSPKCNNTADGMITVSAYGGMAPYNYLWNTSASESEIANLNAGTYSLTVTDAAGCTLVRTISLAAPESITMEVAVQDIDCYGNKNGRIEVSAQGGAEPYSYSINGHGVSSGVLGNLKAGIYTVGAIDNNGCEVKQNVYILQPERLELSSIVTAPTCKDLNNASVEITVVGGTAPYSYNLGTNSSDSSVFASLRPSVYSVFVTDANGCNSRVYDIVVPESKIDCLRIPNVFTPNGDGVNDEWIIENIELFPEAHIYVYNRWGQLLYHGRGDSQRWDGCYRGHFVPSGVYIYLVNLESVEEKYEGSVTVLY
jgi:gliding motility-associated-like protein